MDWIQGDKFKGVADFTYSPKVKLAGDYDKLPNTFTPVQLKDRSIIYTHTMYVKILFDIIRHLGKEFIIITHNCDGSVVKDGIVIPDGQGNISYTDYFILPGNVIKWYSTNVNTINPRIESIPTGIENNRWLLKIPKKGKMIDQLKQPRKFRNLVYMNHRRGTNPNERQILYDLFEKKYWVTLEHGKNGRKFDNYLDTTYNHKFVFSPRGNGMDSHRTWECLYIETIPILKRTIDNQFYQDLPICFVDNWEDITEEFLLSEYERIKSGVWNMEKLTFEYWKNKILAT